MRSGLCKCLALLLAFSLAVEPALLLAQSGRSARRGDRQRPDRRPSARPEDLQEEGLATPLDIRWIGKIAYDAVIASGRYIVGPGDTFVILVNSGEAPEAFETLIGAEGKLIIPHVGAVQLAGLSLAEARGRIQSAVQERFRLLDIQVSLVRLRSFPVNVIGEVRYPGAYMVEGAEQVSELISKAGGLLEPPEGRSSFRNIQIQKLLENGAPEPTGRSADLALWQASGDLAYNPFLLDGDQVYVPAMVDSVHISGDVRKPGNHEFIPGDRVAGLVTLAGGLAGDIETASAELLRISRDGQREERISIDLARALAGDPEADIELRADDKLHIEVREQRVTIEGEVYFPGSYIIGDGLTLKALIRKAGGFTSKASLAQSSVIRRVEFADGVAGPRQLQGVAQANLTDAQRTYLAMKTQQLPGRLPVDFVSLFRRGDESQNIRLKDGDVVRIPRTVPAVLINGFVIAPGAVPYDSTYTVQNYIARAGGFNDQAARDEIYIVEASTGNWIKASKIERIHPGDTIFVQGKKPVHAWRLFRETLIVLTQVATLVIAVRSIR